MDGQRQSRPPIGVAAGFSRGSIPHVSGNRDRPLHGMKVFQKRAMIRNGNVASLEIRENAGR